MTESPTFQRLTAATIEEHKQIHFYLDRLEESLPGLDEVDDAEPLRRLAAQIDSLRERLDEHIAVEEGGLYHAIAEAVPGVSGEIRRLGNEHTHLVELLEMARIRARRGDVSEARILRSDLEQFLRMVRAHERSDDALLHRAVHEENDT